jgi:GT2 family glycosyltransferase
LTNDSPFVSVIVPCREEGKFIQQALDSIVANDFPKERLEVLVVDGMSEDDSRPIISQYVSRYPFMRLIDNPRKITSAALNTGIAQAKGSAILWMSAHNRYEKNYISRCVECLGKYEADNVGGVIIAVPRELSLIGRAIVDALGHRFGVGSSYFRVHTDEPRYVDTVFGGCYRRDVFDRVGLFNEKLVRGQDMEFNLRLRKAGGRILLVPDIVSHYYARSDMVSFIEHNFRNGEWAVLPFLYSPVMPVRPRHLVPLGFLLSHGVLAAAAPFSALGLSCLIAVAAVYAGTSLLASAQIAVRERNPAYLFMMPVVFLNLHFWYGLGSLKGLAVVLWRRLTGDADGKAVRRQE